MWRRISRSVVVGAVALAGCGQAESGDPPPEPAPERVAMSLDRSVVEPGQTLRLTVENRGDERLEYGLAYRLERWDGSKWDWLNRDAAFALILKLAEPGARKSERIGLPDGLRPGTYRIVKSFRPSGEREQFDATVRFRVR